MNDATQDLQDDAAISRSPHLIPWIVVGMVAVLAILISVIAVNVSRGNGADATLDPAPTAVSVKPAPAPTSQPEPSADPAPETHPDDRAPNVDVGSTSTMAIPQWDASTEVSGRFGSLNYMFEGETMKISSALTDSFPASCGAEMKTGWGVERVNGTSYRVVKPATQCADSPELFDQIWGLTQAMADAIKPA